MEGQIFISYRRDDSAAFAGRIYDRLESHLGSNYIFMDVDKIDYGVDFIDEIEKGVGSCDALIAVIGRNWLISADKEGRCRLDNPEDFVRIEIGTALKRGVRVIPVLVDGAIMPRSTELPEDLRLLARRHALEIRHDRFNDDCKRLIAALQRALEPGRVESRESKQPLERVESATSMEKPLVNSLGMRFVAVPGTDVLFSVWETRVKDYQAFRDAIGRKWEKPDFAQTGDHPAVNVSWEDSKAFCEWLSEKEGKRYRLPTDHEWSCAVGIGDREDAVATPKSKDMKINDVFPWGEKWPPPNDAGNYFGDECRTSAALAAFKAARFDTSRWEVIEGFNDGNVFTAPVGSFRPNKLGIYDLGGNVSEWCQDDYEPESALRVLRGGSWDCSYRGVLLSSYRDYNDPGTRVGSIGFRVMVEAGFGR